MPSHDPSSHANGQGADQARRLSIRRRAGTPTTATGSAADEALQRVLQARGAEPRRASKRSAPPAPTVRGPLPKKVGTSGGAGRATSPRRAVVSIGLFAAAAMVVAVMVGFPQAGPADVLHLVAGRVEMGRQPVAGARIAVHPRRAAAGRRIVRSAVVQEDGSFAFGTPEQKDGLPSGDYVATVVRVRMAPDGSVGGNDLPGRYASPSSSPLVFTVGAGADPIPTFTITR